MLPPPAEKLQNFFGVFLQFQIGVDNDAIGKLSPREQAVIRLRFFEDMKLEEIAQCTGTNLNTVKSRLYKALKKLKEMTGEEIEHES